MPLRPSISINAVFLALSLALSSLALSNPLDEPIQPVPHAVSADPARARLGMRLFNDRRLSFNDSVSCATCHRLDKGGADGLARSIGPGGKPTSLNTPTILNAALNFRQFWDGRAPTLESQIDAVIHKPVEMGSNWADVVRKVSQDASYATAFAAAYREGVTRDSIANAIASYERTLNTPDAPFDRYLRGEREAISADARAGYARFKQYGCVACHQGVNVGGNMFQRFGVMHEPAAATDSRDEAGLGRFRVTRDPADLHVFKVPGLRNVALTAPYFHDASAPTLEDAVDVMFRVQLGRTASKEDKLLIIRFLETLTGRPAAAP